MGRRVYGFCGAFRAKEVVMVTGLFNANLPMLRMGRDMDRLLGRVFEELPAVSRGARVFPAVNVWEDGDNLYAEAELPGIALADIDVSVIGDELAIAGERKTPYGEDATFHRRERGFGTFRRAIGLPTPVDADRVSATLNHGVLRITLPKAAEAKPRKIEVKSLTA